MTNVKPKNAKSDRDIFRHITVSMENGRNVDKDQLVQQELCSILLTLATTDSALHSTNKAELVSILEADARNTNLPSSKLKTCTIIDGMALIRLMGKP